MLAAKTAVAAVLAWLLVQPIGGLADDYPYYAPLGAVVAMSTTVAHSVRSSAQAVLAIALGAGTAFAVEALPLPEPVVLGVAVAIGTLMAGWRRLGQMGGWVPFAALFVLIVGKRDPTGYAAAYAGLTALGAVVGVGVNMLLPQLPLTPAAVAQDRLREEIADGLDQLAEGLAAEHLLTQEDWESLRPALVPQARHVEELVAEAMEARRGNWRAKRWAEVADRRYEQARALQRLAGLVDEVITLVSEERVALHAADPVAGELRSATVRALRAVAAMLRSADEEHGEEPGEEDASAVAGERAAAAVAELREQVSRAATTSGDHHAAAAVTINLEQAVEAWT